MEKFCKDCQKRTEKFCSYREEFVPKKYRGKENLAKDCPKFQPKRTK